MHFGKFRWTESKEKAAFAVPGRNIFQFKVLPFGLSNAAQCHQRLMEAVFGPALEPNIFVYLDDIIIVSATFEEHLRLLREVARRLREANLTVNIEKCSFFRSSLRYLGFIVDWDGLKTDPEKVAAMVNFPRPKNTTEIKRFTGMCGWYRRFIPHFSTLMAPINDLLKGQKKGQRIAWNPKAEAKAEEAFQNIKQALVSPPILTVPDFSLPFTIQCDASNTGLGCVLTQTQNDREVVIAFASRSLSKNERNYTVTEKECLACVFAVEKFRSYVEGVRFTVVTDDASLKWLHNMRNPTDKLARWSVKLNQYDMEIVHCKGRYHVVPDALSRSPVGDAPAGDDEMAMRTRIVQDPNSYPQWSVKQGFVYKFVPSRNPLDTNVSEWKLLVPRVVP